MTKPASITTSFFSSVSRHFWKLRSRCTDPSVQMGVSWSSMVCLGLVSLFPGKQGAVIWWPALRKDYYSCMTQRPFIISSSKYMSFLHSFSDIVDQEFYEQDQHIYEEAPVFIAWVSFVWKYGRGSCSVIWTRINKLFFGEGLLSTLGVCPRS